MRKAQPANRAVECDDHPRTLENVLVDISYDRMMVELFESIWNHDDRRIKSGMKIPFGIRFSIAAMR